MESAGVSPGWTWTPERWDKQFRRLVVTNLFLVFTSFWRREGLHSKKPPPLWWLSISGYTLTLQFALKSFAARQGICAYIVVSESRLTFSTEKDTRSDKKFLRTEPNSSSLHRVTLCWLLSLRSSKVCFILWSISVVSRCCWWCVTARNKSNKSNHRRQGFETRRPHGSKEVNGYNVGGVSVEVRGSSLDTNEKLWALVETCGCLWNPCQMLLDTNLTLWDFPHCTVKSFLRS